eukprot:6476049-Amphidinium_carterae.3
MRIIPQAVLCATMPLTFLLSQLTRLPGDANNDNQVKEKLHGSNLQAFQASHISPHNLSLAGLGCDHDPSWVRRSRMSAPKLKFDALW